MRHIDKLLIVIDGSEKSRLVLEKAAILGSAGGATAHVLQVVYEGVAEANVRDVDQSLDLKALVLSSAEEALEDLVAVFRNRFETLETSCVWNHNTWEGILHAADAVQAGMILQVASVHSRLNEIIHTPDDWNVLRHASIPVMLVKPQPWVDNPVVLAALDVFDEAHRNLNLEVLRTSIELVRTLKGELQTVTAYPRRPASSARTVGSHNEVLRTLPYDAFKAAFESDIRHELESLRRELGVDVAQVHAREGSVGRAIREVGSETRAEIIVLGTHGREGLKGMLLGNTAERILHSANTDVVTVRL